MREPWRKHLSFAGSLLTSALLCTVLALGIRADTQSAMALQSEPVMTARQRQLLVPGGDAFGIKVYASGVMVVGTADIETPQGVKNPATDAGVRVKDIITAVDGVPINTVEDLSARLQNCDGAPVTVTLQREDKSFDAVITPVCSIDGKFQVGLWVRDSTAGIGTVTFYDPASGWFGGLGHAICDVDTGEIIPIDSGTVVGAKVLDVRKGVKGSAGELIGIFDDNQQLGSLKINCNVGVFGQAEQSDAWGGEAIPIAFKEEIREGPAQIICAASGQPQTYDIEITRVMTATGANGKSMAIEVVDPDLIALTGGIVQGMSGSPILQDGRLVGAVTHVMLGDPTCGYGIFMESMLEQIP